MCAWTKLTNLIFVLFLCLRLQDPKNTIIHGVALRTATYYLKGLRGLEISVPKLSSFGSRQPAPKSQGVLEQAPNALACGHHNRKVGFSSPKAVHDS